MLKCDDLAIIEELLQQLIANSGKPSYAFGKAGQNPENTWADSHGRPSNKVGIPFGLNNGKLIEVWVGNELLAEFDIEIYYHYGDEIGLTLLKTLHVPNTDRTKTFDVVAIGDIDVPNGCQIAVKVGAVTGTTSPRNIGVYAIITGTK